MTKFVTILARELGEWPENQTFATQDPDKEVRFNDSRHDFYASELADDAGEDYGEGVEVTREMWQAERERRSHTEQDRRHRDWRDKVSQLHLAPLDSIGYFDE